MTTTPGAWADRQGSQYIRVEGGFGYGVIGADIHVFGDGLPVYVLRSWQPPEEVDDAHLTELPSRMLNARHEVVPFSGRADDLAELRRWRASPGRLALRWLHGPGGQGKTRLAARFAADSAAAGWRVVTAVHGPGTVLPPPGSQDLRLDGAAGVLLLVDYADRWPLAHLTWLLSNALLHRPGVPARVLLLARGTEAWPAVRAAVANLAAATSSQALGPLPGETGARDDMFRAARDAFASRYGLTDRHAITPPGSLEHPDMALTLAIHLAALVAVDAYATGIRPPPGDYGRLTLYLLDREHQHWATRYGDAAHDLDPTRGSYRTPPAIMNQAVFVAALAGSSARPAAAALIDRLDITTDPGRLLDDHAQCYPPAGPDRATVLEPLYPDRLAEDFLALTIEGHDSDYPALPWAARHATALLAPSSQQAWHLARSVIFLASSAARWPHVGTRLLIPRLRVDPSLAVAAGSSGLSLIAALPTIDLPLLQAIDAVLEFESHSELDVGAAALADRLVPQLIAATSDESEQATLLAQWAFRLVNAGRLIEAEQVYQRAAATRRRTAAADPRQLPALAFVLTNLALLRAKRGALGDGVALAREACDIYSRVTDPDVQVLRGRAAALASLAGIVRDLGRSDESLAGALQAVDAWQDLLEVDERFVPEYVDALAIAGPLLSDAGRHDDALATLEQATYYGRRIAAAAPARWLPVLATALREFGRALSRAGRPVEAIAILAEAVAVDRQLVELNPAARAPALADDLQTLTAAFAESGRWSDALGAAEEALAVLEQLAAIDPAAYRAQLGTSRKALGEILAALGSPIEALRATEEAVAAHRAEVEVAPEGNLRWLAESLEAYANRLSEVGRHEESLDVAAEVLRISRQLAAASPRSHGAALARAQYNLGIRQARVGQLEAGLVGVEEAAATYRRLVHENEDAHLPGLGECLTGQSMIYGQLGRRTEALARATEAVTAFRRLRHDRPDAFASSLAFALNNLAAAHGRLGQVREAVSAAEESVDILRGIGTPNPEAADAFARALNNLALVLAESGQHARAAALSAESVQIRQALAAESSTPVSADLGGALLGFALVRASGGFDLDDAWAAATEAVGIYEQLVEQHPDVHGDQLVTAYLVIAELLDRAGRRREAAALRRRLDGRAE
ncbi:tetratricopeptide repeat protein [Micromonospora sp. NPDC048999]|uniref:tetratricopeptide repeat protein n=1 Tax=Micromonospora sp. NPDC048999 TaxID=3155391 RepID=UPI0033E6DDDD